MNAMKTVHKETGEDRSAWEVNFDIFNIPFPPTDVPLVRYRSTSDPGLQAFLR